MGRAGHDHRNGRGQPRTAVLAAASLILLLGAGNTVLHVLTDQLVSTTGDGGAALVGPRAFLTIYRTAIEQPGGPAVQTTCRRAAVSLRLDGRLATVALERRPSVVPLR